MMDPVLRERPASVAGSRLDILVFGAAFFVGLGLYFALRAVGLPQLVVSVAVVSTMVGYAIVVARVPRLRVRLDQAGDNAYYLGLLFTLVSMAVALYEFGVADALDPESGAAAQAIIANFGIALASTITGIFLRILLHQMRVDPADVEGMTRIELAEAAKRVKAVLDNVSVEVTHMVSEMRQRSSDQVAALFAGLTETVSTFSAKASTEVAKLVEATSAAQVAAVGRTALATEQLAAVAEAARTASERLAQVEPPPLKMATRLDRVSDSLDRLSAGLGAANSQLSAAAEAADTAVGSIGAAGARVLAEVERSAEIHGTSGLRIADQADKLAEILQRLASDVDAERARLTALTAQFGAAATAADQAHSAATRVLEGLSDAVRGMTAAIDETDR